MTVKQKQCLLCYLGYYTGAIDGIWGNASEAAAKQFQQENDLAEDGAFGRDSQEKILEVIQSFDGEQDWWKTIRWWKREEFRCRCGGKYCGGFPDPGDRRTGNAWLYPDTAGGPVCLCH